MLVSARAGDGGEPLLRHTHEVVFCRCSADSVNGDGEGAVGSVFEADGEGEAGGKLAMELGFGRAGTDGSQRDEIGEELRGYGVQHLAGDGHAGGCQVDEQLPRHPKAFVDLESFVNVGVVDQALPADRCARLLEVGPHDDTQVSGQLVGQLAQAGRIFNGGGRVMDGARAADDEQPVGLLAYDLDGFAAAGEDRMQGIRGLGRYILSEEGLREVEQRGERVTDGWDLGLKELRGDERVVAED